MAKNKNVMSNLNSITRFTNLRTYGVSKDLPKLLSDDIDEFVSDLNNQKESNKSLINSHISKKKINTINSKNVKISDLVKNEEILNTIESTVGIENIQFSQLLKDYEMIKRCLPQVHRVVNVIRNNIISPDSMGSGNILGIDIPEGTDENMEKRIRDIVSDYKLNSRVQNDIVNDYLIASVKYVTVVPYSIIPEMLKSEEPKSVTESIEYLDKILSSNIKTLTEAAGGTTLTEASTLLESAGFTGLPIEEKTNFMDSMNMYTNDIEFVDGGMSYYKNAILNEAIDRLSKEDKELKSMENIVKKIKNNSSGKTDDYINKDFASEGLIDDRMYKSIKNKVDFKGCHIEYLQASKTIAFKLRDTVIGYFFVEDKIEKSKSMSIMDKINASVYMKNSTTNKAKEVENSIIRNIGEKLIKAINPKFLRDNNEDMDIIYEFVRLNELHKKSKRVVFFHPDDVCEFKRSDGSIMKNCMFFAKLVILTLLSNIITKVTRGSDRNIHYVKNGLTTDIEGDVNDTIRAIKQNQIRYSDIGTINEIFNIVGSNVDVFMPVSVDGERPIETETISGQSVDMNDDFINTMIRSIIQSFGCPAAIIDDFESVEFAKTISMSNIEMAKATYDAQIEINPILTKMFRMLVKYEIPEYDRYDEINVSLSAPAVILYEMNRDRIDSIDQVAEKLSELLFGPDDETPSERMKRLFKLEYYKKNMASWDWNAIDEMVGQAKSESKIEEFEKKITGNDNMNNDNY